MNIIRRDEPTQHQVENITRNRIRWNNLINKEIPSAKLRFNFSQEVCSVFKLEWYT